MNKIELKPHNQETYDKLNDMLKTDNRVACVQPTGTGKSYIALRYIEDNPDKKILLLAPTDIILNQFKETVEKLEDEEFEKRFFKNVSMAKYLDLGLTGFQNIYSESWDTIIMDEFHRTGASVWNTFIDKLISMNPEAKLIGLSATPIRFLDDYRNMGEEIFNGNYACHYNVNDAWKRGILPIPKYVLTDYRITEGTEKYIRNRYPYATSKERIDWIVKQYLENGGNIHQILKENLPNNNGKFIVFCSDAAHIKKMRPVVKGWLEPFNPKIHMYTTLSMDDEPDAALMAFKNDDSESIRLLFCVERLNEGLHLSNLDGIVMLRPTSSPIIYLQQMGRTLGTDSLKEVVIFDLVNNFSEYRRTVLRYRDMTDDEIENLTPKERAEYNSYKEGKYDEFLKFDFVQKVGEICDLFDEIDVSIYEYNWNRNYLLLKEYLKTFKRFPYDKEIYKGILLGRWITNEKIKYKNGKMELNKIQKFNDLGIIWDVKDEQWNYKFELFLEYIRKNTYYPKANEIYKGVKLGAWVSIQRKARKNGAMDINRYHKLKNINFVWDQKDEQWHEMYNLVEKIFKDNSSSKDLIDDKLKHKISAWLYSQRIAKNKGKLSKDKIEKLNNLSIDWNPNKNSWLEKYYLLNEFVIKNKRIPKENEIVKDKKSLRNWFRHQLEPNQYDKLTDYQKNLIDNLKGYLKNDSLKMQWNTKLLLLEEYRFAKNEWPSKNITYKGVKIGQWLNTQKTAYKKGKLSKDRQGKLESIGFVFDENKK